MIPSEQPSGVRMQYLQYFSIGETKTQYILYILVVNITNSEMTQVS